MKKCRIVGGSCESHKQILGLKSYPKEESKLRRVFISKTFQSKLMRVSALSPKINLLKNPGFSYRGCTNKWFSILFCLMLYCNILYRWPWRLMELIGRNGRRLGPSLCFLPTKFSSGEVANRTNYREPTPRQTLLVAWRRYVFILDEDPKIVLLLCAYDQSPFNIEVLRSCI